MLTLPPEVGNQYLFKDVDSDELFHCVIIREDTDIYYSKKETTVYKSKSEDGNDWTYWPDGKARTSKDKWCAYLVEDAPLKMDDTKLKQLQEQRKAMQQKLKELSA